MASPTPRFTTLRSRIVPLLVDDVDTDQIIPAEYLKTTIRDGLGEGLFAHWRKDPDFALGRPGLRTARVLLAGDNFGCGSSREHAPWALLDYGFRAVVALGFADIFRINALRNGLLTVEIQPLMHRRLREALERQPLSEIRIDLETQRLSLPDGSEASFAIEPFARRCLLDGVDQLGYLLKLQPQIETFEQQHPVRLATRAVEVSP